MTWDGDFYTVHNARISTLPAEGAGERSVPVPVSGFGPKAVELAARIGDGFVSTSPSAEHVSLFSSSGGTGVKMAGMKVCWGPDEEACKKLAHSLWPNSGLSGELSQELPMPAHFEQASSQVGPDQEGFLDFYEAEVLPAFASS